MQIAFSFDRRVPMPTSSDGAYFTGGSFILRMGDDGMPFHLYRRMNAASYLLWPDLARTLIYFKTISSSPDSEALMTPQPCRPLSPPFYAYRPDDELNSAWQIFRLKRLS